MKATTPPTTAKEGGGITEEKHWYQKKDGDGDVMIAAAAPLPSPIQGRSDWRDYRCLRLENGVTLCLVHDGQSKTTAAAACVRAGASADPRDMPGLAHFCEHMCFLGSAKYPSENEYKRYLSQHGGRSNASTSMHLTTYKFEVLADHAERALDLFGQFFVAPLFTESGTGREVNAVDSENSKNLTSDVRRRLQILKDLADREHYFSKFSTGNAKTLPTSDVNDLGRVRETLRAFHRKHYRPDRLAVVVAGPQSLDQLQDWVVPKFASMSAEDFPVEDDEQHGGAAAAMSEAERNIARAAADAPEFGYEYEEAIKKKKAETTKDGDDDDLPFRSPFSPSLQESEAGGWPCLITSKPVRSMRRLDLMFPVPAVQHVPDTSPVSALSHLLGHEGPGSAFAVLQSAGLLSSLSAGSRVLAPDFTLFHVDISLTEKGERHWKDVASVIFENARLISSAADNDKSGMSELRRIWDESATLSEMFFHQTSPGNVYDFCPGICSRIVTHGTRQALAAHARLGQTEKDFPADRVRQFAALLVPSNCIIERCSKAAWEEMEEEAAASADGVHRKTEQWYGIDYFLSALDAADVATWGKKDGEIPPSILGNGDAFTTDDNDGGSRSPLSSLLHLPRPNRYIPRSLELSSSLPEEARRGPRIDLEMQPPELIVDSAGASGARGCRFRLWHRLDDRYALPKAHVTLLIRNAAVDHVRNDQGLWEYDITASVHASLLSGIFSGAMAVETYDADLAGLYWNLSLSNSGLRITASGFSDRLADLVIEVLQSFYCSSLGEVSDAASSFVREPYFSSTKDRVVRNLRTYLESRRADAHAAYYRDFLLSSKEQTIRDSLDAAEAATVESVQQYLRTILGNDEIACDCLFIGNISGLQARDFFEAASRCIASSSQKGAATARASGEKGEGGENTVGSSSDDMWIPGSLERRLPAGGRDVELHFASRNPAEENGACLVTFQSPLPGFRGVGLSSEESLRHTAAVRMLAHMIREPLYDELRTKQTLGYVVSSYYDVALSCRQPQTQQKEPPDGASKTCPLSVPVDLLVVNVLSRKVSPVEVLHRIDSFLEGFRETLVHMPESEIRHHATALSTKLRKPVQKLASEASRCFTKIYRYSPEILLGRSSLTTPHCSFSSGQRTVALYQESATTATTTAATKTTTNEDQRDSPLSMPWNSVHDLADAIESSVGRRDLLGAWDRMMLPDSRGRIVSCVYGTTFPLRREDIAADDKKTNGKTVIIDDLSEVIALRGRLPVYDNTPTVARRPGLFLSQLLRRTLPWTTASVSRLCYGNTRNHASASTLIKVAAATAAVLGAGYYCTWFVMADRPKKVVAGR